MKSFDTSTEHILLIKKFLYYSQVFGQVFFDIDNDDLMWIFNNVNRQTCYLSSQVEDTSDRNFSDNIKILNSRRYKELFLMSNVKPEILKSQILELSEGLSKVFFTKNMNLSGKNKEKINLATLLDEDFEQVCKPFFEKNTSYNLKDLRYYKDLLKEPWFSIELLYNADFSNIEFLVLKYQIESSVVYEILHKTSISFDLPLLDSFLNKKAFDLVSSNVNHLFVMDANTFRRLNLTSFRLIEEIFFLTKTSPTPEDKDIDKVSNHGVLKTYAEYYNACKYLQQLGLPKHSDLPKNWDSYAALSIIKNETTITKDDAILDAGGEFYSAILHQLASFGYKKLFCINLAFEGNRQYGSINYFPGDITKTSFESGSFSAVTCLSVIEHGVDVEIFFSEMSRLLKPKGLLIMSTDYWKNSIETYGKVEYGVPIKIFNQLDIENIIDIARRHGFFIEDQLVYEGDKKVIYWNGLSYTFIYFTFKKQ